MKHGIFWGSDILRGGRIVDIPLVIRDIDLDAVFPEQCLVPSHTLDQLLTRDILGSLPVSYAAFWSSRNGIRALPSSFHTVGASLQLITFDFALPASGARNLVQSSLSIACVGRLKGHCGNGKCLNSIQMICSYL